MLRICTLVLFVIVWPVLSLAQESLDLEVDVHFRQLSLKEILQNLTTDYGVLFSYSNLDLSNRKSIRYEGALSNLLNRLFKSERIEHRLIGEHIVLKYKCYKGQGIRGKVLDAGSKIPLIGASIQVLNSSPLVGASTDQGGDFDISTLEVGRYDLMVHYLGYEPKQINQVLVSSGTAVQLNIELRESIYALEEAIVLARNDPAEPVNEMAGGSARSFSVEETKRYAASIGDPARMVQVFAGVSAGGDDLSNELIIRGNTSRNLLWRLEGIPIQNPNHFGDLGGGGGAVSMLNSRTLSDSDFYTGAFPAEFGNALSGVFDLRLRSGNSDKRQHSLSIGNLGMDASTEGYFKQGRKSSYLANYRIFSTRFIEDFLPALVGERSNFSDATFKLNFPFKQKGTLSVFGLGGKSASRFLETIDSNPWISGPSSLKYDENQELGVIGLNYKQLIDEKSYLKVVASSSLYRYDDFTGYQSLERVGEEITIDISDFETINYHIGLNYYLKINPKIYFQAGTLLNREQFRYDYYSVVRDTSFVTFFSDQGATNLSQYFFQWQFRIHEKWKLLAGVNSLYFALSRSLSFDPRLALEWTFKERQKLGLSLGFYSKPEHSSTYLISWKADNNRSRPNLDLDLMKAFHLVGSYQNRFAEDWRLKAEAYLQYLYDIPVSSNPASNFSVLNTFSVFDVVGGAYGLEDPNDFLISEGEGINYGIELTLEKFFNNNYYGLSTLSIFDSKFTTLSGKQFPTFNARRVLFNVVGGKEWQLGKGNNNMLGLNGKFILNGGNRYTPIDIEATKASNTLVFEPDAIFSKAVAPYYRFDLGISYKLNRSNLTHTISLDIQNISNHRNVALRFYDLNLQAIRTLRQNGLIPFISWRLDFTSPGKS